ncbi:uncharacterized protein LDX57_010335 [Aspergillus melleus]|uniref:uncharacterized protein n=1 Tax=Aspergillus melleus TaxID=138277 RepID=UPI001E8EE8B0|nr:uncharacterized protein LDX57_010335 [Aspergillus melleus]KAH8432708.1 hypothetical protein LDX57_010335 [Aspergillus melleus]
MMSQHKGRPEISITPRNLQSQSPRIEEPSEAEDVKPETPFLLKTAAVCFICCISGATHWSSGVTKAMKSTIKKELDISNTQFSLLEASEDFMATILIMASAVISDRIGGLSVIVIGKLVYTLGSILIAAAATIRSYDFMVTGRIVMAMGDITTQVAQYKMFSSWFAPSNGFAITLGFEGAAGKLGGFIGKATANIIAQNCGFEWSFWINVFINVFANVATLLFWFLERYCDRHYNLPSDLANGESLRSSKKAFRFYKVFQLPWMFWSILAFSLFESTTTVVFSQNATELAEMRFHVSAVTAGWYSAVAQYGVFFCGTMLLLSMLLLNIVPTKSGTAASFVFYGLVKAFGTTVIVDSIRTIIWEESVFGSACGLDQTMNNAMNIIIRLVTGAIQDADKESYHRVNMVYLGAAAILMAVSVAILLAALFNRNLAPLQWSRKERLTFGSTRLAALREHHLVARYRWNGRVSLCCFGALLLFVLGSWATYIWGAVTGNNF